jgi:Rps23 Pro-64 3,4-dihydroxylase Tpa1-like proline 4-hydroxylase
VKVNSCIVFISKMRHSIKNVKCANLHILFKLPDNKSR